MKNMEDAKTQKFNMKGKWTEMICGGTSNSYAMKQKGNRRRTECKILNMEDKKSQTSWICNNFDTFVKHLFHGSD